MCVFNPFTGGICFRKAVINLYGVFILGVNVRYGLAFVSFGSKVAYTSDWVDV
jgi:hypothetical protein